ncbi:unnamed protein product [Rhizophagus irregularis]|nr:unnamed protein product [Rhizophagus irregularis]
MAENNPKETFILHDGPPYANGSLHIVLHGYKVKTLDNEYEVRQLQVFHNMMKNGYIYRQNKPVHWSPSSSFS